MKITVFCFIYIGLVTMVSSKMIIYKTAKMIVSSLTRSLKHALNIDHSRPIDTAVRLFCTHATNKTRKEVYFNDSQIKSKINFDVPIAFVIHGWFDSSLNPWMDTSAKDWNKFFGLNVCVVDWSKLAASGYVYAVTINFHIAVHYLKQMFEFFIKNGLNIETTEIVGHSLGAHIAGFIGSSYGGKLKTIYGLDPAGPLWTFPVLKNPNVRLDPTDAKWVQVIHSSAGTLGTTINMGHQDFYPNGGTFPQPNCIFEFSFTTNPFICSHVRSIALFISSLNSNFKCKGYACNSYFDYNSNKCKTNKTDLIGPYNSKISGVYYLNTYGINPYCTGQ